MIKMVIYLLTITLFVNCGGSSSLQNSNNIRLYNAYGNSHQLIVHGRMIKKEQNEVNPKEEDPEENGYSNAWNVLNFFHNDEIKNAKIFLTMDKMKYETKGDDEGYFEFNITTPNVISMGYQPIALNIEGNSNLYNAKATIVNAQKTLGIISDIDDTIIISEVTSKTQLLLNTFWKNYKQREVIPTMLERFQKILSENPPVEPSRLFFISGSPQQLSIPIEKFLAYQNFPTHVTILKQIHGEKADPLFDQIAYKTDKIEKLITLYPNMEWIMFGDSGEKDAEIYKAIREKYPTKVNAYYIRNVKSGAIEKF